MPREAMISLDDLPPADFALILDSAKATPEVVRRLILGFRDQYAGVIDDLGYHLLKGNLEDAGRLAHSLRTVAEMLGAVRVVDSVTRLEAALQPGQERAANDAIVQLEQAIVPLMAAALKLDRRTRDRAAPLFSKPHACARGCVLIIDDERSMREVLDDVLQEEYTTLLAADGNQGLRMAKQQLPDLILLDVDLPGLNGYDVLAELKSHHDTAAIPVMFVTGSSDIASETLGLRLGAVDYVVKPINPAILVARIGAHIKIKRAEVEARRHTEREHYMELAAEFEHSALLEQTRQLQLKIKDDFLSHVSHELRAPATSIQAFVSLVSDGLAGEVTAQQAEYLGISLRNVEHLQAMIEDLLEATRLGSGKLSIETSDIFLAPEAAYALQTLSPAAKRKSVHLASHFPPDLPGCRSDPIRLRQTLTILLDNAVKFTPPGGTVTLRAQVFDQDDSSLLVEVADTGCGISQDKVAAVFDRLYQCAQPQDRGPGLGLGLHIAQELVQRQGGKIWVESVVGAGSTFRFTLPLSTVASHKPQYV